MIGIYYIKNNQNNKLYIGQSVNVEKRFQQHKSMLKHNRHENEYLQSSWNKYGENSFEFNVIECCNENELDDLEKKYINEFQTMDRHYGYNLESGGSINKHMSDASKAKMSIAKQGLYDGANNPMFGVHLTLSEERKKALSERFSGNGNPMYGVHLKMSDEQRLKRSEMFSGNKNPFYGKHHTDEAKRKMSEKKRGVKWPLDVILSRGQNKCVRCINNGQEFDSLSLAAQWAGNTAPESISRVCQHKQKTAGHNPDTNEKYIWEFI